MLTRMQQPHIKYFYLEAILLGFLEGFASAPPSSQYGVPGYTPGTALGFTGNGYAIHTSDSTGCKNKDLERNKRLVMDFYQKVLGDKQVNLVDRYLAEDYLNHNPLAMERGRQDFVRILTEGPLAPEPPQTINFRRVDAIGDVVWVHSSFNFGGKKFAVMDIFQINCDGLIAEHWDALQDTTSIPTPNPMPYF